MGSSSSRPRPPQQQDGAYVPFAGEPQHQQQQHHHHQQQQQYPQQPPLTNGQLFGGYAPPPSLPPQQPQHQHFGGGGYASPQQQHYGGGYAPPQQFAHPPPMWGAQYAQPPIAANARPGGPQPPRPVLTQEYTQTATIKNQVNLRKATLKLVPLPGRPHAFALHFLFDATAPCRVTTFLLATEDPRDGFRLSSAVLGAPPRTPVYYEKGAGLKFPPDDPALAEAHVISSLQAPMGHMVLAAGDSYPIVIRLESLTDEARAEGRTLQELEVGGPFPPWAQAQSTYAKLRQDDDGEWQVQVLKQKIWFQGTSYELQEIYGIEPKPGGAAAAGAGSAAGALASYDEQLGGECVICMSADRDTTVLPCRHMCMCQECARALKAQSNKCPICRNEIESLLHIKMAHRTRSGRRTGETTGQLVAG